MPKFNYIVKTKEGQTKKSTVTAASKEEIVSRLRSKGFFIVSIKEVGQAAKRRSFFAVNFYRKGKRRSIKLQDLTLFARNLATTLSSGVTLLRSLEIIANQSESAGLENILKKTINEVRGGLSLGEAFAKYPKVFSSLWRGIVQVGETSGNLPFVLDKLAEYMELRMEFERKIKSALIYPAILMIAATVAVLIFFKFILPKFVTIFDQFKIELPLPTKIVFAMSNFVEKNFLMVVLGVVGFFVLAMFLRKQPAVQNIWDRVGMKLPLLGGIIFSFYLERITSTIYILIDSGLPIVYALEITASSVGNRLFQESIFYVREQVREGASLSEELRKVNLFPLLVSEMSKIGEETGTIADVFQKISSHYRKDLVTKVERIIAAFEPLMIVFMGVIIGGLVISLFLPLFQLVTLGN